MKNRFHWTQEYRMSIDLNNIYAKYQERSDEIGKNSLNITGKFTPYWQYKTETFRMSFSPDFIWERFTYPQKTLLTVSPYLYLYKKLDFRRELTIYTGYSTGTGNATNYAMKQYRQSYRSWYASSDIIPITRFSLWQVELRLQAPYQGNLLQRIGQCQQKLDEHGIRPTHRGWQILYLII